MIACLPMYDWDEVRPATDLFWSLIRAELAAQGIAAPEGLHRGTRWNDWQAPDLILSQTCGFPYRTALHDRVALVGTPDYGLPDAAPGYYYSQLVARRGDSMDWTDYLDRTLAINGYDSQSGWAAPQNHAALSGRRFGEIHVTGAHRASAEAVADGRADLAAIDAVTWRLIAAHRPALAEKLQIVAQTAPTPGLPLITAIGNDAARIAGCVSKAITALDANCRAALGLQGLIAIPKAAYLAVPTPQRDPEGDGILDE